MQRGKEANDQINILGDDGVPVEYHERFWKSELIDFVILQQDAFDDVDVNRPLERQKMMFEMVLDICNKMPDFADFEECSKFFKTLINLFRQMNYAGVAVREIRRLPSVDRGARKRTAQQIRPKL